MAIIVKEEEAAMAWCSHCLNITQTQWEGDSQCCSDCGKILGQIFLGRFIREGKRRRVLSRTGGRRQRRRRAAAALTVEEHTRLFPTTLSEPDSL